MAVSTESSFLQNGSFGEISAIYVTINSSVMSVPEGCVTKEFFQYIPWDNKDSLVPKKADEIINFLLLGLCMPFLFVISFSTNIINIVVFYKHGLKERINTCLFTLSVVDLLSISVTFSLTSDVMYMFIIGKGDQIGPTVQFFIRYFLVGLYGLVTSSQVVYSVIALERCLCVTHPLLAKTLMPTKATAAVLWALVLIISAAGVFIVGVRYSVVCVFNPSDSSVFYVNYPQDFYFRNKFVMDLMYSTVYGLLFPGFSFVCVTVCTVITALRLKKLTQWRETVSSAPSSVTSRDLAITRIIIGTSVLFIVCIMPAVVMRSSFLIFPDLRIGGRYDNLAWITRRFYIFLSAINSSFNFFIYYSHGSKFRETTHQLFPFCRRVGNSVNKS